MPEPKFIAYAPSGGKATFRQLSETVSSGASNLSQAESDAYTRARLMAAQANGGTLDTAKAYLEAQGWDCYWDGPLAKASRDDRLEVRIASEDKDWVLANGGSDMVRRLIRAARERQEAETMQE